MTKPEFHATREGDNLIVIETTGKMDAVGMEVALDMLVREMDGMHHGGILMRAEGVEWPTIGALAVELRHWVQLMAMVEKVDKTAILTDDAWLKGWAAVESALIPNMVVKSFALDDEAGARAWLSA